jgi:hypothetical protein
MNEPLSIFDRMYIVDNFYTDPDQIRNYVLSSNKNEESDGNYAGVMSVDSFLTQEHLDTISTLIGNKVIPSTSFTGKFRFTKEKDEYQQDIHFDPYGNFCGTEKLGSCFGCTVDRSINVFLDFG